MNIGSVVYKKDFESGRLFAEWNLASNEKQIKGTGEATGKPGNSYAGKYKIVYRHESGKKSDAFDLHIQEENNFYSLKWFQSRELKYVGTGMMFNNALIAGWKSV